MEQKTKPKQKDSNLWEVTGKVVTIFALSGAITGPLTHTAVEHTIAAINDTPVQEITAVDLAYASMKGTETMSLAGLFTAGALCLLARRERKKAEKNQDGHAPSLS